MISPRYYAPEGGLPPQTEVMTDRAVFTDTYAVIPRGTLRDIVVSLLPGWTKTRAWVLARPLTGFAETFSQTIVKVQPGGGADRHEPDLTAEGAFFVLTGRLSLAFDEQEHVLEPGGFAYLPAGTEAAIRCRSDEPVKFHRIRKAYEAAPGYDKPPAVIANERDIEPISMPDTNGVWATTRFVDPEDLRHDMHS